MDRLDYFLRLGKLDTPSVELCCDTLDFKECVDDYLKILLVFLSKLRL